jgi:hypothetical protein
MGRKCKLVLEEPSIPRKGCVEGNTLPHLEAVSPYQINKVSFFVPSRNLGF